MGSSQKTPSKLNSFEGVVFARIKKFKFFINFFRIINNNVEKTGKKQVYKVIRIYKVNMFFNYWAY